MNSLDEESQVPNFDHELTLLLVLCENSSPKMHTLELDIPVLLKNFKVHRPFVMLHKKRRPIQLSVERTV